MAEGQGNEENSDQNQNNENLSAFNLSDMHLGLGNGHHSLHNFVSAYIQGTQLQSFSLIHMLATLLLNLEHRSHPLLAERLYNKWKRKFVSHMSSVSEEYENLEQTMDELDTWMNELEEQNDNLNAQLDDLLKSSQEARKELQEQNASKPTDIPDSVASNDHETTDTDKQDSASKND